MPQDKKREGQTARTGRRSTRLRIVSAVILIAVLMCVFAWKVRPVDSRSIDEKFAAIDAEFAIPDSENAAVFYRRFFRRITDTEAELRGQTGAWYREPWTDDEYPEQAAALDKHRALIQQWLGNSRFEKARFSVKPSPPLDFLQVQMGMQNAMPILTWAAANDLGEGRPDAAFDKYRCQMQMARHISQQPATNCKGVGSAYAGQAHDNIIMAAMQDETTPEQLRALESILEMPMDRGGKFSRVTTRVERLLDAGARSKMSIIERLKQLWYGPKKRRERQQSRQETRLEREAKRRATFVMIALRRHKERTGSWPELLEQIELKPPAEMLIDPRNNGPFGYRLRGDSFVLYTRGPNGIDEIGTALSNADDYAFWPRRINKTPPARR